MIKVYATQPTRQGDEGYRINNVICAAFAEGFDGQIVPTNRLLDGPLATYGILRGTTPLIHQCQWVDRDYYYMDNGMIKPGHFEGYYRLTRNEIHPSNPQMVPDDRWRALGVKPRPWRRDGKHVLITPLTDDFGAFYGIDPDRWSDAVVNEISRHTNRKIVVRPKPKGNAPAANSFTDDLKDCWCLVTHSSNTAIVALLEGIPVIILGESGAKPLSWTYDNLEAPDWPDREPLFHWLAYNQFTLDELRDGTARRIIDG